uniref:Uncharacterized protein n=1 Tax=Ananas comosus var. bracteatus TaxID=296719 RepID=A0A6V7Q8S1_ANACO|nr:unnamed protein product [Ananas comosus var. bracteatus]
MRGYNILPQKWLNVYNYKNPKKMCHKDEIAAHKEQLKREQSCHHGAEYRLECLRQVCSLAIIFSSFATVVAAATVPEEVAQPFNSRHINLFDGVLDFAFFAAQDESKRPLRGKERGR